MVIAKILGFFYECALVLSTYVSFNADLMTLHEIHEKLREGYSEIEQGNVQDASDAFRKFRKTHE